MIAISVFTAVLLGYCYLLLIDSCLGKLMIWISILLIQAALIGGGYYIYKYREKYDEDSDYRDMVKYFAYGVWCIAAFYLCCLCCYWKTIRIGIAVYQSTAQYVHSNMRIYLLPLVADIVETIWFTIWLVSAIWVFSVGEPQPRPGYEFITEMKWEEKTRNIVIYQFFMLFWMNAFILGVCQFIIGASACIWYFEVNSDTEGKGTVGRGMWWAFRYHLGSVAFGAALIAICQMIRAIFEYYARKI